MKHTSEQKCAKLLATARAEIEELLDWEEQAVQPKLADIETEVQVYASGLGSGWLRW